MEQKYKIGDIVFKSDYARHAKLATCPDCLGSKYVRVILGDGTELQIECGGCDPGGYEPSTGVIRQYDYETQIQQYTVTGVKVTTSIVEYELDNFGNGSYYTGDNNNIFATKEEAMVAGEIQRAEHEENENKRLMAKTKNKRSWAWNATYHRRCIKDLEQQLVYHHSKVKICDGNAKIKGEIK